MHKYTITGVLVGAAFVVAGGLLPLAASAQTASSLSIDQIQSQISTLLQQIANLKLQLNALSSTPTTVTPPSPIPTPVARHRVCGALNRDLRLGAQGDDVRSLQEFLAAQGKFSAEATGYFGAVTSQALFQWQNTQGVSEDGVALANTRAAIAAWCGGGSTTSQNAMRFTATPMTGSAPLAVSFNTWLSGFRTPNVSYIIDYGDGASESATNCPAPADACTGPGVNSHTYSTNGAYTATLFRVTDPCAGQTACRAAVFREEVGKVEIRVGPQACTMEYNPVCGKKPIVCITTPCDPVPTTYGNRCAMEADGATFAYQGECRPTTTPPSPPTPTPDTMRHRVCKLLTRSLSVGMQGDDVRALQEFLRDRGVLNANATGYFGALTTAGVAQWQTSQGVSPLGIFGPLSRERLLKWCRGEVIDTPPTTAKVLSATPTSGAAPLAVSFRANVSIMNPQMVADAGSYKITFGDGSEQVLVCNTSVSNAASALMSQVVPGTIPSLAHCAGPHYANHTYASNGTYTASLVHYGYFPPPGDSGSRTIDSVTVTVGSQACTKEYMPVCGSKQVQCITAPCNPVQETYSNRCMMNAAGATFVKEGMCNATSANPENDPKCKAWYDGCNSCSRSTPGGPAMCTLRACINDTVTAKYCSAYFTSTEANLPPVISSISGPTSLAIGASGTWTVQASDPENGSLKYMVQWGDEWYANSGYYNDAVYPGAAAFQSSTFTHSYATAGNYKVQVLVRDEAGKEAKTSTTVQVGATSACPDVSAPVCGRPSGCANTCPVGMYCAALCQLKEPVTYQSTCHLERAGAITLHAGVCTATSGSQY